MKLEHLAVADGVESAAEALAHQGVKYLLASYVDMHGVSKAKMVPVDHYGHMLSGSELFTGAANDGVPQQVSDEEVSAHADPRSCKILPWNNEIAWFASDLWCEGKPFEACVVHVYEGIDFLKPRGGTTTVSYSVRFTPTKDGS